MCRKEPSELEHTDFMCKLWTHHFITHEFVQRAGLAELSSVKVLSNISFVTTRGTHKGEKG